jgi:hypothetical protein
MPNEKSTKPNPFDKLYKRKLSSEELAEIRHNFFGVMDVLVEIYKEQKELKRKDKDD